MAMPVSKEAAVDLNLIKAMLNYAKTIEKNVEILRKDALSMLKYISDAERNAAALARQTRGFAKRGVELKEIGKESVDLRNALTIASNMSKIITTIHNELNTMYKEGSSALRITGQERRLI